MGLPVSRTVLLKGKLRHAPIAQSVRRNAPLRRSADTFAVFHPHGFLNSCGGLLVAWTHRAAPRLAAFAPSIGVGANLTGQHVYPTIQSVDVAPTVSAIAGAKSTSTSRRGQYRKSRIPQDDLRRTRLIPERPTSCREPSNKSPYHETKTDTGDSQPRAVCPGPRPATRGAGG